MNMTSFSNISMSDVILLGHATFGILGTLSALWVFVEALNAREENATRIRTGVTAVPICLSVACILGGYWYLHFYPAEKAIILQGPWTFAHNLFMETKEHLFFITLILALYLPIAAAEKLYANASARTMVLCVALMIVITGMAIEGAGAIVDHGVKVALLRSYVKGAPVEGDRPE
jgi:hypothetical protein